MVVLEWHNICAVLISERKIFRRIYGPICENGEWEKVRRIEN